LFGFVAWGAVFVGGFLRPVVARRDVLWSLCGITLDVGF